MSDLKICHVNLARGFRGGERQTELLIQNLSAFGVKQMLLVRKGSPLAEHLNGTPNLTIITLKKILDLRFSGHLKLGRWADIVQAHEARAAQWAYLHFLSYKTPFVTTRRVPEPVRNNAFNRSIYTKAAAVVAISQAIGKTLEEQFKREITAIPSACAHFAVNHKVSEKIKERFKDDFVIGHAGALVDRHKGQTVILKAASLLKDKIPNLKVVLLGSGPSEEEQLIRNKAAELNLEDKVIFEGFVNNVGDYMASFDVFAYPSNYEGLGSVLLDVMEQGVPIAASNVDGIPDIVENGKSGVLIEKQDAQGLAAAILKIKEDSAFRQKIISGAIEVAKAHSPEQMAKSYLSLYESLMTNKRA